MPYPATNPGGFEQYCESKESSWLKLDSGDGLQPFSNSNLKWTLSSLRRRGGETPLECAGRKVNGSYWANLIVDRRTWRARAFIAEECWLSYEASIRDNFRLEDYVVAPGKGSIGVGFEATDLRRQLGHIGRVEKQVWSSCRTVCELPSPGAIPWCVQRSMSVVVRIEYENEMAFRFHRAFCLI